MNKDRFKASHKHRKQSSVIVRGDESEWVQYLAKSINFLEI